MLIVNPYQPFRLEPLAAETKLSIGQVSQVIRRLQDDDLVERKSDGCLLTKPRRLLRLFAQELMSDYTRNRTVFSGFRRRSPSRSRNSFVTFVKEKISATHSPSEAVLRPTSATFANS